MKARFKAAWERPRPDEVVAVVPGAAVPRQPEVPPPVTVRISVWRAAADITRQCVPTDVEHIADLLRQRLCPQQRLDPFRGPRFRLLDVRLAMRPDHQALLAQHFAARREHSAGRTAGSRATPERQGADWPLDSPDTGVDTYDQLFRDAVELVRGLSVDEKRTALTQVPVLLETLGMLTRSGRGSER